MRKITFYVVLLLSLSTVWILPAQMMGPGRGGWGRGPGMMGQGMMGEPWNYVPPGDAEPMSIDDAVGQVELFLERWGNPDLELAEVMEFSNHFYAEVEEKSTGVHAFEILVNRYTGEIFSEPGPNMMWNAKYGHMGGGMGWGGGACCGGGRGYRRVDPTSPAKVNPDQAIRKAQKYLDALYPGLVADTEVDTFYGYYTIHTLKDGKVYGMLSVNSYSGDVWYHTWHGRFVGMKELEEERHG